MKVSKSLKEMWDEGRRLRLPQAPERPAPPVAKMIAAAQVPGFKEQAMDRPLDELGRKLDAARAGVEALREKSHRDREKLKTNDPELAPLNRNVDRQADMLLKREIQAEHRKTEDELKDLLIAINESGETARLTANVHFSDPAIRERQLAIVPLQDRMALRDELRSLPGPWQLTARAQLAHSTDDVALAVAIEHEIDRRSQTDNRIDRDTAREIRQYTRATENDALNAERKARALLKEVSLAPEIARLEVARFKGRATGTDRIRLALLRGQTQV